MKARSLKRGDVIVTDGRGDERVLWNQARPNGKRFVRTSRFDHFWDSDKEIEIKSSNQRKEPLP
jgi:hypothetical protein